MTRSGVAERISAVLQLQESATMWRVPSARCGRMSTQYLVQASRQSSASRSASVTETLGCKETTRRGAKGILVGYALHARGDRPLRASAICGRSGGGGCASAGGESGVRRYFGADGEVRDGWEVRASAVSGEGVCAVDGGRVGVDGVVNRRCTGDSARGCGARAGRVERGEHACELSRGGRGEGAAGGGARIAWGKRRPVI